MHDSIKVEHTHFIYHIFMLVACYTFMIGNFPVQYIGLWIAIKLHINVCLMSHLEDKHLSDPRYWWTVSDKEQFQYDPLLPTPRACEEIIFTTNSEMEY